MGPPGALLWRDTELRRDLEVTAEAFGRKYRYQVGHAYGARRNMREAPTFGCAAIQRFTAPQARQAHGCPFQRVHEAAHALPNLLPHWGLSPQDAGDVLRAAQEGAPSAACAAFFRASHPRAARRQRGDVRHPNEYFRQRRLAIAAGR